jgi:hypothetical protein
MTWTPFNLVNRSQGMKLTAVACSRRTLLLGKDRHHIWTKEGLCEAISSVTGINYLFSLKDASMNTKMSSAAKSEIAC